LLLKFDFPLDDYHDFIDCLTQPPCHGLRTNFLKTTTQEISTLLPYDLQPIPWCKEGFIYPSTERPAKSLAYFAGLFYIQEPSAMLPAVLLDAKPGEAVLDICAAPGGKSVQIAGQMQNEGLLISNDASASRSRALIRNLELAGVTNAVVLNEQPAKLAGRFVDFFDRILVDAPCSGEGMFRRDPEAKKAWTENKPEACALIQKEILKHAAVMLKPGGRLVYSACTFNTRENEEQIESFLKTHGDFSLVPINHPVYGISPGLNILPGAARIWPHRAEGEGHFAALLIKRKVEPQTASILYKPKPLPHPQRILIDNFIETDLKIKIPGEFIAHHENIYRIPDNLLDINGLRIARMGWHIGKISKDRFKPSHAMALGLKAKEARYFVNLGQEEAVSYIKGYSIPYNLDANKKFVLVGYKNHPLGWAVYRDGLLKNKLPVNWVMR
jgi:NOL1/NOP2/sun family putative RNA methylase